MDLYKVLKSIYRANKYPCKLCKFYNQDGSKQELTWLKINNLEYLALLIMRRDCPELIKMTPGALHREIAKLGHQLCLEKEIKIDETIFHSLFN